MKKQSSLLDLMRKKKHFIKIKLKTINHTVTNFFAMLICFNSSMLLNGKSAFGVCIKIYVRGFHLIINTSLREISVKSAKYVTNQYKIICLGCE